MRSLFAGGGSQAKLPVSVPPTTCYPKLTPKRCRAKHTGLLHGVFTGVGKYLFVQALSFLCVTPGIRCQNLPR